MTMRTIGVIVDHTRPNGTILSHMVTYRIISDPREPYWTIGVHIWGRMGPQGTLGDHMGPYGTILDNMGPYCLYRTIGAHTRPYETIWAHTAPQGILGTIGFHRGLYWTIKNHTRPYKLLYRYDEIPHQNGGQTDRHTHTHRQSEFVESKKHKKIVKIVVHCCPSSAWTATDCNVDTCANILVPPSLL